MSAWEGSGIAAPSYEPPSYDSPSFLFPYHLHIDLLPRDPPPSYYDAPPGYDVIINYDNDDKSIPIGTYWFGMSNMYG